MRQGGRRDKLLGAVPALVLFGQKILAEIAVQVAPDHVDMISSVLGVVVLNQERRFDAPVTQ
jgi:hypothetical protein